MAPKILPTRNRKNVNKATLLRALYLAHWIYTFNPMLVPFPATRSPPSLEPIIKLIFNLTHSFKLIPSISPNPKLILAHVHNPFFLICLGYVPLKPHLDMRTCNPITIAIITLSYSPLLMIHSILKTFHIFPLNFNSHIYK